MAMWTSLQKIAFRFCVIFLGLQVLSESFIGNWFGGRLFIWELGDHIFTRPCLWLNDHFFHFKYIDQGWTTFSGALHTIRDFIYLLLSCIACLIWTLLDRKRPSYNKMLYWFSRSLVVALSCIMFAYGVTKLFPVQMAPPSFNDLHKPLGELSPFNLLWVTYGYGGPYQVFSGFFETAGAILILFNRTRVIGLLTIVAVIINVIMLNYTYHIGVLVLSFYILLVALFLLAPYAPQLWRFFIAKQPATLMRNEYRPAGKTALRIFAACSLILIITSFYLNTSYAYDVYTRRETIDKTRKYSTVMAFNLVGDTVKIDDEGWKTWNERTVDGKRLVTIAMMKTDQAKTYTVEQDSNTQQLILRPFNQPDTVPMNFRYSGLNDINWTLEGTIGQKNVRIRLMKISPDTIYTLLKTKRNIITFDDEENE